MKFRQFVLRKDDAGADAGGGTVDRGDTLPEPKTPDTAAADAAAEALKIQFITGHATSGSGGSAMTPTKLETGFAAAGSSCEVNNTTIASTGTAVVKHQDVWNVQLPYQYRPMPEEMIVLSPSERLVVRMPAPADSLTVSGSMIIEEIGG